MTTTVTRTTMTTTAKVTTTAAMTTMTLDESSNKYAPVPGAISAREPRLSN